MAKPMPILSYIQRMNQLYGNDPTPVRFNTQKYLQGGRVGMKPGGLVEPGVVYYGRKKPLNLDQQLPAPCYLPLAPRL